MGKSMIFDITRLTELAGQDFTNPKCRVRSPHITARESIEIGDYIVAQQKRIAELENKQGIRDLEQQAKGIERVLCESSMSLLHRERMVLKRIMRQLREQAKRLKDQPNV